MMRRALTFLVLWVTPVAAQQADTAMARVLLSTEDWSLATSYLERGPSAFIDRLTPGAAVLLPGAPILRGADAARAPFTARYGAAGVTMMWMPQDAIVASNGRFGCTVGTTSVSVASDTSGVPRPGRYITCWTLGTDGVWRIAGHARTGETPAAAFPSVSLHGVPHSSTLSSDTSALRQIIGTDSAFAQLAVDSGPAVAFARNAAADAMTVGAREAPARGPAEISAQFSGFPRGGTFTWGPERTMGAASGGLGFTVGEATITTGQSVSRTKYLTVWRLEPDGRWRFVLDMGSPRP